MRTKSVAQGIVTLLWLASTSLACGGTGPEGTEASGAPATVAVSAPGISTEALTKHVQYVYGRAWDTDGVTACDNAQTQASRTCPTLGSQWDTCSTWVVSNRRIDGGWYCTAEAQCCWFN